jgi:hypothetical protein
MMLGIDFFILIRDLNLKVEIFWNLNKTSHMSELNPCCGAIHVKTFQTFI